MASKSGWTFQDVPDQTGKTVIITGSNSGIGLETARYLAIRGASVILAVRNSIKGAEAMDEITSSHPGCEVEVAHLDLADLSSIKEFARWFKGTGRILDVLINNAGVMGIPRTTTVDGFELQFGTNHLGHFALTGELIETLLENNGSRIVNVASNAHRQGVLNFYDLQSVRKYGKMRAYAQSKLANLVFTAELDRRLKRASRSDVLSVAAHPGMAESNIVKFQPELTLHRYVENIWGKIGPFICQTSADGAIPTLRAATDPSAEGNDYYGPNHRFEIRGPAVKVKAKKAAYDVHDGRALWEQSIELTGVDYAALDLN